MSYLRCLEESSDGLNNTFDDLSFYEKLGKTFCQANDDELNYNESSEEIGKSEKGEILENFEPVFKKPKTCFQDQNNNYFNSSSFNIDSYQVNLSDACNTIGFEHYKVPECDINNNCTEMKVDPTRIDMAVKMEDESKEFENLSVYNFDNSAQNTDIFVKNQMYSTFDSNCIKKEEEFWNEEVNLLFSQDVRYQEINEILHETSLPDSVDSSTYDFVHSWCDWLHLSNKCFDKEEEGLLKSIRKDYILQEDSDEDLREIQRKAIESRQSCIESVTQESRVLDADENDEMSRKRDRECDRIALKYNRCWRRKDLEQQAVGDYIYSSGIYGGDMKAYTLSGQCYTADLSKCRPSSFCDEAAMRMWDHSMRVNSHKLVQSIEERSFFPLELDRKVELQFLTDIKNITHEACKLARFFERTHFEIINLLLQEELIILFSYLLSFQDAHYSQRKRREITEQLINMRFSKLSFIRQPHIMESLNEELMVLLGGNSSKSDVFLLLNWLEKEIFHCSKNAGVFDMFSVEKTIFDLNVENLSVAQIMTLTAVPQYKLNEYCLKASYEKPEKISDYVPNL